jgi:hypothetical protein
MHLRYSVTGYLTPRSKVMLDELVEHVRRYAPQPDVRTSEVFQAVKQLDPLDHDWPREKRPRRPGVRAAAEASGYAVSTG